MLHTHTNLVAVNQGVTCQGTNRPAVVNARLVAGTSLRLYPGKPLKSGDLPRSMCGASSDPDSPELASERSSRTLRIVEPRRVVSLELPAPIWAALAISRPLDRPTHFMTLA